MRPGGGGCLSVGGGGTGWWFEYKKTSWCFHVPYPNVGCERIISKCIIHVAFFLQLHAQIDIDIQSQSCMQNLRFLNDYHYNLHTNGFR